MSHYTEEEQIAQMKDWWQRNGKSLILGVIVALALVIGWQTWQKREAQQAENMSVLYQQLLEASFSENTDLATAAELLNKLDEAGSNHAYTQYARLIVARLAVDEGRLADAQAELAKVEAKPASNTLGELAQQRLARVLAAQGKAEDALQLLTGKGLPAYQAMRDELRGDILMQLGRAQEARTAYLQAQKNLPEAEAAADGLLLMKLDSLAQKDS